MTVQPASIDSEEGASWGDMIFELVLYHWMRGNVLGLWRRF